jgi:hypothetical protein
MIRRFARWLDTLLDQVAWQPCVDAWLLPPDQP